MKTYQELVEDNSKLKGLLETFCADIDDLINNSEGVAGLHKNGDIADWDSLQAGGQFEGWLLSFNEAATHLDNSSGE